MPATRPSRPPGSLVFWVAGAVVMACTVGVPLLQGQDRDDAGSRTKSSPPCPDAQEPDPEPEDRECWHPQVVVLERVLRRCDTTRADAEHGQWCCSYAWRRRPGECDARLCCSPPRCENCFAAIEWQPCGPGD